MSNTPDILTMFFVAFVFFIMGRAVEKMQWIEKTINFGKLKEIVRRYKSDEETVFEE